MFQLVVKAVISAILVIAVSEIAKRGLAFGARVASLPLVSVLGLIWLWRGTQDASQMAARFEAILWYV